MVYICLVEQLPFFGDVTGTKNWMLVQYIHKWVWEVLGHHPIFTSDQYKKCDKQFRIECCIADVSLHVVACSINYLV